MELREGLGEVGGEWVLPGAWGWDVSPGASLREVLCQALGKLGDFHTAGRLDHRDQGNRCPRSTWMLVLVLPLNPLGLGGVVLSLLLGKGQRCPACWGPTMVTLLAGALIA